MLKNRWIGFILDGMDEYQPQGMKSTYINKLLGCLAMPRALVVAVSRPAAVAKYRRRVSMRIEVRGFFMEQIADYIESYQFSSQSKCSDLTKYLEDHPNIHHMCYLPIQAAMVCFLFDELGGSLPQTETEIYKEFTKHAVLRTMYRYKEESIVLSQKHTWSLYLNCKEKKEIIFVIYVDLLLKFLIAITIGLRKCT